MTAIGEGFRSTALGAFPNADSCSAATAVSTRLLGAMDELAKALSEPESAGLRELARSTDPSRRLKPLAFSLYFRLLRAVLDGDGDPVACARSLIALGSLAAGPIEVKPLGGNYFTPAEAEVLRADFASESLADWQIGDMTENSASAMVDAQHEALAMIRNYAPHSWADVSAVASEIVVVIGGVRDGSTFDGCSSVERWGSILVNGKQDKSPLERAETLVHESAHSLLFALSPDESLLHNGMSERHKSPLRSDPRPLDGIFHAVFVLDRMCRFLDEVAANAAAPSALRAEAKALHERRRRDFRDGLSVLEAHAHPTPSGLRILRSLGAEMPAA